MRVVIALVRREYWEHQGTFVWLPMLIGGLLWFAALCAAVAYFLGFNIEQLSGVIHVDQPAGLTPLVFYAIGIPFVIVLWCVMAHYFLGALFDDRKDRSVLFWQSLPISQTQLLASKLIAGLLLAPLLTLVWIIVTQLALLILGTIVFAALHIAYWPILWRPMPILLTWWGQLLALLEQSVWLFPIAAWFMLCSAFSRRAPLLRAVVPLVILLTLELCFSPKPYLLHLLLGLVMHVVAVWSNVIVFLRDQLAEEPGALGVQLHQWQDPILPIGIVLGVIFVAIAGWLRSRCYDR